MTERRLDEIMDVFDGASRALLYIAGALTFIFIILPAIVVALW